MKTSYMGYTPQVQSVRVTRDCFIRTRMKPLLFEIEEITVESGKRENELGELTPSNLLAFSGGDLFSQIWILPGVTSSLAGQNFMVDGADTMRTCCCWMAYPCFILDISVRFCPCSTGMP